MAGIEKGVWRVDLHVHSTNSDGLHDPNVVVFLARKAKLDLVGLADHDRMSFPNRDIREHLRRFVVPHSIEVTTAQGHVEGFWLHDQPVPRQVPRMKTLRDTVDFFRDHGAMVNIPHPTFGIPIASVSENALDDLYQSSRAADTIEVATSFFAKRHHERVRRMAEKYDIAELGVSDDHLGNIGREYITVFERRTNSVLQDLEYAIRQRTTKAVKSDQEKIPVSLVDQLRQLPIGLSFDLGAKIVSVSTLMKSWYEIMTR